MIRFLLFVAVLAMVVWSWRNAGTPRNGMTAEEAARLLGLPENADASQIAEAHKRLIAKVHPDAGGSAELAARVNLARDTLLGRQSR